MNTVANESPPDRGPVALFAAIRCIGEAVQANVTGDQVEAARQLAQADGLLAEAGRVADVYLDSIAASLRRRGPVAPDAARPACRARHRPQRAGRGQERPVTSRGTRAPRGTNGLTGKPPVRRSVMSKTFAVVVLLLVSCEAGPVQRVSPTESEVAMSACQDLEAAHLAMCQRCGIKPPLPPSSASTAWKYADCSRVTAVKDVAALYDTCIPALASGCYEGDTPAALDCHQLEF